MSFLVGTFSGALVASGVYYAFFSRNLETRNSKHLRDLHLLVNSLQGPQVSAPLPAAARVQRDPRMALLKQRWNEEIEGLFHTVRDFDKKVIEWGRRIIGDNGSH